ncbi:TraR/DksA family transcriptional regulator [Pseudomonas aeruginosa]
MDKQQLLAMPESEYMNDAQVAYFKGVLSAMLAESRERIDSSKLSLANLDTPSDPADLATVEEARGELARNIERDSQAVRKVRLALDAIEDGEYGYCSATGAEIGLQRLLSQPAALFCFDEQTRLEQLARHQAR